jgi:hypothetical protein
MAQGLYQQVQELPEMLTSEELEKRVLQIHLANTSERTEQCVRQFIESAVYMLRRPCQVERRLLIKYYTTCLLSLEFLPPLLCINLSSLKQKFTKVVVKEPYKVENPFDIYFVCNTGCTGVRGFHNQTTMKTLAEITEDATKLFPKCRLNHADDIRRCVIEESFKTKLAICREYRPELHARLLVYSRVLPKLMGITDSEALKKVHESYALVVAEHGECGMQFPNFLSV